jgi:hypothetical protein
LLSSFAARSKGESVRNEFILVADRSDGFVESLKEALATTSVITQNRPLMIT